MNNYLILVPSILGVLATLVAWYYKGKAIDAQDKIITTQVQAQDAPLAAQQAQDQAQIAAVDAGIQKMKDEQAKQQQPLTDEQRAASWNTPPKSS
jgi:hypothetical protein